MKKTVQFSLSFAFLLLFSAQVFAQGVLKGKVIDSQNLSLPGASVVLKGTANGTVTNQPKRRIFFPQFGIWIV